MWIENQGEIEMKRTKKPENPTAILTADWHIRESIPVCRTDDFWKAQWGKVKFINDLQQKYDNTGILFAGDLYDTWKPSPLLLTMGIKLFPQAMECIYGNHDLPQHSLEQASKCGMNTLSESDTIFIHESCHWGMEPDGKKSKLLFCIPNDQIKRVLLWHVMTYPSGNPPWPGCEDLSAGQILDKYPEYDLIVTGHNHKTFIEEKDGRPLVNPGSLMRQDADQIDHKPCVFLWYAESNRIERVEIPHEKDVISREHLDKPNARKERLRAYIENMSTDWEAALSFAKNLEKHFKENKSITKMLKDLIWQSMEK